MSEPAQSAGPPAMDLMRLIWPGAMTVQAIHVAATLGLADLVAGGPKTAQELADATRTHGPSLGRVLKALATLGIFAEDSEGRFGQTPLSDALRADHPQSMQPLALMLGAGFMWEPIGELETALRTGMPVFDLIFDAPFFAHLAAHPDDAAIFNGAMSSVPAFITALVEAYDFSRFARVADIGGGHGALLAAVLTAHPHMRGVLYDLPEVVAGAEAPPAVGDRMEIVAGSFFDAVPSGADAYLLKGIIHDWNDASAARILENCRRVMPAHGRLLILDNVLNPSSNPSASFMDLLMMVLTGGRERTEGEFRMLLGEAGFSLERVIPTAGHSILECRPA